MRTFRSELRMLEEDIGEDVLDWDKFSQTDSDFGATTLSVSSLGSTSLGSTSGFTSRATFAKPEPESTKVTQSQRQVLLQQDSESIQQATFSESIHQPARDMAGAKRKVQVSRPVPNVSSISVMGSREEVERADYIPETLSPLSGNVQSVIRVQEAAVVPPGQVLHVAAVLNPATSIRCSVQQAIQEGLIDVKTGRFVHPQTGRRMSLGEAAQQGLIEPSLVQQLHHKCGLHDPSTSRELSILEAMQKGYFDPTTGQVTDPRSGRRMSLQDSVSQHILTPEAASNLSYISITTSATSRTHGFYEVSSMKDTGVVMTLADALDKGLYNQRSGKMIDPVSKQEISILEAIQSGLLDQYAKDIVHPVTGERLSLEDAISQGVVDPRSGMYVDPRSGRRISLDEASLRNLVIRPLTLDSAITDGLLDSSGRLLDLRTGRKLTLKEAIEKGVLDTDVKCILDPRNNDLLSLEEAIERGIISASGEYVDPDSGRRMSVQV